MTVTANRNPYLQTAKTFTARTALMIHCSPAAQWAIAMELSPNLSPAIFSFLNRGSLPCQKHGAKRKLFCKRQPRSALPYALYAILHMVTCRALELSVLSSALIALACTCFAMSTSEQKLGTSRRLVTLRSTSFAAYRYHMTPVLELRYLLPSDMAAARSCSMANTIWQRHYLCSEYAEKRSPTMPGFEQQH